MLAQHQRGCGSLELSDIECDGRRIDVIKDPPGQRSVYIIPGDPKRETYRLSTFKDYPAYVPIDNYQFAANGFYYTGYKDRVKCFSCGQAVENWVVGDDPSSIHFHKQECPLMNGSDSTNIPILSFFQQNRVGRNSPSIAQQHSTSANATSTVQHSYARQISTAGEIVLHGLTTQPNNTQSASNSSIHQTAAMSRIGRIPPPSVEAAVRAVENNFIDSRASPRQLNASGQCTNEAFPCLYPVNPHMRNEESRLQTFIESSSIWPAHRIRATPREIAQAGMYFLGERDRVKCWYCNGGLQNWERDDEAWEEHAKWYPLCEFVLQQKGPDFVYEVVRRFPNLRRPNLYNPANSMHSSRVLNIVQSGPSFLPLPRSNIAPSRGPVIVDPREELRDRNRKIEEEMTSSELVSHAKIMGFEERLIRVALKRKYESDDRGFSSLESLTEAILSVTESAEILDTNDPVPSTSSNTNTTVSISNLSASAALQEMRRLEESRKCKICHNEPACIVFIPCGCLVSCVECGNRTRNCPICHNVVRERFRSYMA